jgi:hypothetical protein
MYNKKVNVIIINIWRQTKKKYLGKKHSYNKEKRPLSLGVEQEVKKIAINLIDKSY